MTREVWAVIPSYARITDLARLTWDLLNAGVHVVIVDNGYEPPLADQWTTFRDHLTILRDTTGGGCPNLSRLWNLGLAYATENHTGPDWACMIVNDDTVIPTPADDAITALTAPIYDAGAAATFPSPNGESYTLTEPEPVGPGRRMTGWWFVVSGRVIYDGFRFDEQFAWWYGDDDTDWTLRTRGGVHAVAGLGGASNSDADGWSRTDRGPALSQAAGEDRARFQSKWGRTPW